MAFLFFVLFFYRNLFMGTMPADLTRSAHRYLQILLFRAASRLYKYNRTYNL